MTNYDPDIICITCGASPDLDAPRNIGEWNDAGHEDGAHLPNWSIRSFPGSEWDAHPSQSLWSGEVIVGRPGETDYFYGYADCERAPDVELLVPRGWELLESVVKPTPKSPAYAGPDTEDE